MNHGVLHRRIRDADTWGKLNVAVIAAVNGSAILAGKLNSTFHVPRIATSTGIRRYDGGVESDVVSSGTVGLTFFRLVTPTEIDGQLFGKTLNLMRERCVVVFGIGEDTQVSCKWDR